MSLGIDPPFFGWQLAPVGAFDALPPKLERRSAKEIIDEFFDGLLWDTPKKRRSIEVRLRRKFGDPKWKPHGWKMIDPKNNLMPCPSCGNFYEPQYLCETCYQKNKSETQLIKDAMAKSYGFDVIDREVRVSYKGEPKEVGSDALLVEIDKQRPSWFSSNLLTRTNAKRSTETNILPEQPANKFKD